MYSNVAIVFEGAVDQSSNYFLVKFVLIKNLLYFMYFYFLNLAPKPFYFFTMSYYILLFIFFNIFSSNPYPSVMGASNT